MFSHGRTIFINLIVLFCLITCIAGKCYINLPDESNRKPYFYTYAGRHQIKLNTDGKAIIELYEEQRLEVYCDTKFDWSTYYNNQDRLFVKCKEGYIYTASDKNHGINSNYFQHPKIQCSVQRWNLYEAASNLDWCPNNLSSYIVAKRELWKTKTDNFNRLAGICYDTNNLTLHSIYYTLAPNGTEDVQPAVLRDYQPEILIDYIKETFGPNSISGNMPEEHELKNWLDISKYEFSSIIQHVKLNTTFNDQFAALLEFVWWPNLRLYNWKRYVDALEEHVEDSNQSYDILAGISGTLKSPMYKLCQGNHTMREVWLKNKQKIPLYVWNYIQDNSNRSNEVVIIGFNSPFYEFYSPDDVIFCPDICQEISWLKKAKSSFRYNIMGIVFCCNVKDVRSSKRLDGFPAQDLKTKQTLEWLTTTSKPKAKFQYDDKDIDDEIPEPYSDYKNDDQLFSNLYD